MARLEMPRPDEMNNKETEEKKSAAGGKKEVKEGDQEKATAEGDSTPADADVKKR